MMPGSQKFQLNLLTIFQYQKKRGFAIFPSDIKIEKIDDK